MAKLSRIEILKQKLAEEKIKKENADRPFNRDIYPFWTMDIGDSARVRILPDKNEDNDFFFFEDRLEHTIAINGKDQRIPCRAMYGEDCPICDLSRKYYKEEGKQSKNGKYYYRKKTSIVRLLVLEDPLPEDKETGQTYAGKVFNTQFGYQLMEKIKEQMGADDLGDFTDYDEGYDFIIKKTPQGDYGTYSVGSQFARKASAIPDDLREEIELVELKSLLPQDFGFEKVQNMLQAHLSGEEYEDDDSDTESKNSSKKEASPVNESKSTKTSKVTKPTKVKPVEEDEDEDEEEGDSSQEDAEDEDEDDIIAQLRARRNAAKK